MSRRALIAVSAIAHVCLFAGVFVSGVWRLERLDGGRAQVRLTQPLALPDAAAGGRASPVRSEAPPKEQVKPRVRSHTLRPRPDVPRPASEPPSSSVVDGGGAGQGSGSGAATETGCTADCVPPPEPVCGNGSLESGEGCDDGNLLGGDGCSATCRVEPRAPATAVVAPSTLAALRRSGETQIHPSDMTQHEMAHDDVHRVEAILKVCVLADGSVGRSQLLRSTGYGAYDAALLAAVRDWRYEPYRVNGAPVPACSTVRFVYTLQ